MASSRPMGSWWGKFGPAFVLAVVPGVGLAVNSSGREDSMHTRPALRGKKDAPHVLGGLHMRRDIPRAAPHIRDTEGGDSGGGFSGGGLSISDFRFPIVANVVTRTPRESLEPLNSFAVEPVLPVPFQIAAAYASPPLHHFSRFKRQGKSRSRKSASAALMPYFVNRCQGDRPERVRRQVPSTRRPSRWACS